MPLKVGFVGLPRATGCAAAFRSQPDVELFAGCDTNPENRAKYGEELGLTRLFDDYTDFLDAGPDIVVVGTPMPLHVPHAIGALARGMHVISEVPAMVDLIQAWQLVSAARQTNAVYMMGENYCYIRSIGIVREMVAQGLFGELYYGEGEYLHELKELNEITKWRRTWQTGLNGVTYGTHSLGPLLSFFKERVVAVNGLGTGQRFTDPRGQAYENEASCSMDCKLENGGLLRIRVDMLSNRPHLMDYYSLQGTKGCFEMSRRGCGDVDKIWLANRSKDMHTWRPVADFEDEFLPANWRKWEKQATAAGHGGGDFLQIMDFLAAVRGEAPCPIDVYTALDYSMPGLVSQESIRHGGCMLPVPDFRTINKFPDDLPVELHNSHIIKLADDDGQPLWLSEGSK
jgi:predicted dehydrogenase